MNSNPFKPSQRHWDLLQLTDADHLCLNLLSSLCLAITLKKCSTIYTPRGKHFSLRKFPTGVCLQTCQRQTVSLHVNGSSILIAAVPQRGNSTYWRGLKVWNSSTMAKTYALTYSHFMVFLSSFIAPSYCLSLLLRKAIISLPQCSALPSLCTIRSECSDSENGKSEA